MSLGKKAKLAIFISLPVVFFVALCLGGMVIPVSEVIDILLFRLTGRTIFSPVLDPVNINVLMNVRLPRIVMTFIVGMSLAVSGAAFQAMLKNPLVDPYILGLSSGAAFGVSLFSIFIPLLPMQVSALIFGLVAVGISYGFATRRDETSSLALVLAGVMISAVFTALLSMVQLIIDPLRLQSLIYWTMGSFNTASWERVLSMLPLTIPAAVVIFIMRWRLNILALDDNDARYLGINAKRDKTVLILAAAVLASSAVAVSGIIILVGLVVPHIVRMLIGADNRALIPVSMALGASYLTVVDIFSRTLFTFEMPVGIFTTLIGAPFFIFLLRRMMKG